MLLIEIFLIWKNGKPSLETSSSSHSFSRTDLEFGPHKPIPAKAFPGRAAILIKLLGIDKDTISAVYEIKGSLKTGNYVPGTRIPILPEKDLYKLNYSGPILNLAWHLSKEVRENLSKNSFEGNVFDILDQKMMKSDIESGI